MMNVRERLISSASLLFAEKGYHAVGTREISAHAKANISSVSFYFRGKNGLLKAILESLITAGLANTDKILVEPETKEEFKKRLRIFMENLGLFYIKHSAILRVYMQELEAGNADAKEANDRTFGSVWQKMIQFLKSAQKKNIVVPTDATVLTITLLSPFNSLMQNKNCSSELLDISIENERLRQGIIDHLVESMLIK